MTLKYLLSILITINVWTLPAQHMSKGWSLHFNESLVTLSLNPGSLFIGVGAEYRWHQRGRWTFATQGNLIFGQTRGMDQLGPVQFYEGGLNLDTRAYYSFDKPAKFKPFFGLGAIAGRFAETECNDFLGAVICLDSAYPRLVPFAVLGLRFYPFGERWYVEADAHSTAQLNLRIGIMVLTAETD